MRTDVGLAVKDAPRGVGDVVAAQAGGGHLVQQRLKGVVVVGVDDGDVHRGVGKRTSGGQAPEAGADDHDVVAVEPGPVRPGLAKRGRAVHTFNIRPARTGAHQ